MEPTVEGVGPKRSKLVLDHLARNEVLTIDKVMAAIFERVDRQLAELGVPELLRAASAGRSRGQILAGFCSAVQTFRHVIKEAEESDLPWAKEWREKTVVGLFEESNEVIATEGRASRERLGEALDRLAAEQPAGGTP